MGFRSDGEWNPTLLQCIQGAQRSRRSAGLSSVEFLSDTEWKTTFLARVRSFLADEPSDLFDEYVTGCGDYVDFLACTDDVAAIAFDVDPT